jgi:two-component system phosphate regulon sensor histidine kinase PhoR
LLGEEQHYMHQPHPGDEVRRLKQRLGELESLVQVIGRINRSLEVDDVLRASRQGVQRVLGGGFGCFILIRPATDRLELALADELSPEFAKELEQLVAGFRISPAETELNTNILVALGSRVHEILKTESQVLIPLTARSRPIGILVVGLETGRVLTPLSVDLLMSIGEQVGMAIENARLHASLRESEQWHRTFIQDSPEGCWEGDLTGRIRYVNDAACKILGFTREELLRMQVSDFGVDRASALASREKLFQTGLVIDERSSVRIKNGDVKTISWTTRLIYDGQGRAVKYQTTLRDVTEQQYALDKLTRRTQELSTLNSIATIMSHPLELMSALDQVCEQITYITGMEGVAIFLPDASHQVLVMTASRGLDEWLVQEASRLGLDDGVTRRIAVDGETIALDDVTMLQEEGFAGPRAAGYHAGIGVPIKMQGRAVGAIFVGSKTRFQYEKSDVALLVNVGLRVGMALENRDLYMEMQRRVDELSGLAELSAGSTLSLDPNQISNLAVEWTQKLLGTDMCSLRMVDGDAMRLIAARTTTKIPLAESIPLYPVFKPIVAENRTLSVPDLARGPTMPPEYSERFRAIGLEALLFAPMFVRDRAIGILMVGQSKPHDWSENEIRLLQTIANQTANVIDNAQLYQNVLSEQRKVQAIFDSGLSGLYATDAEGRIAMFNRAAERITGWKLRDVLGRKWAEVFADQTLGVSVEPLINEALLRKRTFYVPDGRKIQTSDGRMIPVAKAVAPLMDENGEVTGAVGAFWDLSREKAAEMSRESFLSMVAHEMRNPLTALIGALELVENSALNRKRRHEMNEIIKSQAERLKRFSQQFLDLEKEIRSQQPVKLEDLSAGDVVRKLVNEFEREHCSRKFEVHVDEPEPLVHADAARIDHILVNLLDNAISYSADDSVITVRVQVSEDRPGMVDIAVQDRGRGISISDQVHVFEAFYRAGQLEGRRVYGHGLGLYIAMENARQMEASLELESEVGVGTTFHLILRRSTP